MSPLLFDSSHKDSTAAGSYMLCLAGARRCRSAGIRKVRPALMDIRLALLLSVILGQSVKMAATTAASPPHHHQKTNLADHATKLYFSWFPFPAPRAPSHFPFRLALQPVLIGFNLLSCEAGLYQAGSLLIIVRLLSGRGTIVLPED